MAYDEALAERIRGQLKGVKGITEKRMFGGIAFMSRDYMFVGVSGDALMVRVGPTAYEESLRRPHVRVMDFTGRPMKGYVFVDRAGLENARDLRRWLDAGRAFVDTLPERKRG